MTGPERRLRIVVGAAVLAALIATPARAQRYQIHTYSEGDGLASSTVRGMVQDPSGRMWFCTRAGITVFDGLDWSVLDDPEGIELADWSLLARGRAKSIWAASAGLDVGLFDGSEWSMLPRPDAAQHCVLRSLVAFPDGEGARVALGSSCGIELWDGSTWRHLGVGEGLPDDEVNAVEAVDDRLYVATRRGLAMVDSGSARVSPPPFELRPESVTGLASDPLSPAGLWIVGADWLGRVEGGHFETLARGLEIGPADSPRKAVADGEGGVFFGHGQAFYHYHPQRGLKLLDSRNGLISEGVSETYRDRENNVWVSSTRGVSKIVSFRFATFLEEHGLYDEEVTAVLERRDGSFVLGHQGGLTLMKDDKGREIRTIEFPESPRFDPSAGRVLDLAEDARGTVWIAGNHLGLGRLDGDRVSWLPSVEKPVTSVLWTAAGRLWVASGRHVIAANDGRFERMSSDEGIDSGLRRLVEGESGAVWALYSEAGAVRFFDGRWEGFAHPSRPDLNNAFAVYDHGGARWVGTTAGLCAANQGRLEPAPAPAPVIQRPVYFMLRDTKDRVWFGTDNGVMRWDGETLDHFTVEDGLGGRETNRAAGMMDSRGHVWIGTTRGVTIYREELDRRIPVPPMVSLHGLEASGEREELSEPVYLEPDRNDLVFSFRAISFCSERDVRIRAWLEGDESDWSEAQRVTDGRLRYTNLSPGRYRLHLQAGNAAGLWSDPIISPDIVIVPPFYGRAWFWTVALAAAGLVYYAGQRYVYERRYARQLENEVSERMTELRRAEAELFKAQRIESLGVLAGGIAHDFNNLLMVILGNLSLVAQQVGAGARRWICDAEAAIERARQLTAQLLTFSRGGAPVCSAARVEDVIRESATFVLRGSSVRCEIDLPHDLRVVGIDTGQINQVLNNLLLNALQAMPSGGTIRITGRNVDELPGESAPGSYVEIAVRDEGEGIPEPNLQRVFDPYFTTKEGGSGLGLTTAYSIARRHGGLLTVESEPGQGATFKLYLRESEAPQESEEPSGPVDRDVHGTRVLIMDDNEAVRGVVAGMLEEMGCIVAGASDGEEALRIFSWASNIDRPFDVVILDLTVPGGMGGEETMRQLRELDPEVRGIVASGYANASVMSKYRSHGFQAALQKPFRADQVKRVLRRVVQVPTSQAIEST